MCGINGILSFKKLPENTAQVIQKMNDLIIHRGPDDSGVFESPQVIMGMQRLSIIEIKNGHQPMFNENKTICIVFNGEIYNFKKIQLELKNQGVQFFTNSDTEVILKLYEIHKEKFVDYLEGMFAFSIYDILNNKLIIGRDRFGEKPLYYTYQNDQLIWASELKSIISTNPDFKKIDENILYIYFSLTYIPAPHTIYKNIYKLSPGHILVYNLTDKNYILSKYYSIKLTPLKDKNELHYEEAKKHIRKQIIDSVEQCMIADVPICAFLSGGVDSAIISSLMAHISTKKIKTFTVAFRNKRFDESIRAREVANHIHSQHFQYFLEIKDIISEIQKIILNFDEPFADSSFLPTYFISKKASEHVKVALTGEGSDEVFGGYNKYYIHTYFKKIQEKYPYILNSTILKKILNTQYLKGLDSNSLLIKLKKIQSIDTHNPILNHFNIISLGFSKKEINTLLNKKYPQINELFSQNLSEKIDQYEALDLARKLDFEISLEGDLLTKVDRCTMLNSLETRSPFLNQHIVDYSFQLPQKFLIKNRNKKRILKDIFADILPTNYLNTPKKGFELPIGDLIRNELKQDIEETLSVKNLAKHNLININYVQEIIKLHIYENHYYANKIWCLYCFQKWWNNNFDII